MFIIINANNNKDVIKELKKAYRIIMPQNRHYNLIIFIYV